MSRVSNLTIGVAITLQAAVAAAAPPPVSAFMNFASYQSMKISPDGSRVAYTQRDDSREYLAVVTFPEMQPVMRTGFGENLDIDTFYWASDTRLLVQPLRRIPGLISFKARTGEIFGVDADGKNGKMLFGIASAGGEGRFANPDFTGAAGEIIDLLRDEKDTVLIQTIRFGQGGGNSAYRMNIHTGRLSGVATSPLNNGDFLTDAKHNVAVVSGDDQEGNFRVYFRTDNQSPWQLKKTYPTLKGSLQPLHRSDDVGRYIAVDRSDGGTSKIVSWDPVTGDEKLLFQHEQTDIAGVNEDDDNRTWMFTYVDHFPYYWYPAPQHPLAVLHQALRQRFRNVEVEIVNQTRDGSLAVASISSPVLPPRFLIVDVKSLKVLQQLQAYPELKSEDLSPMEPIEFRARDGAMIRGYLTTPNVADKKKLPTVVLVHGGPHGIYDAYGFNPEVQLLASRGYAVLQINYRGSGGRGLTFEAAGYGKWGREMQDDITDGVKWAVADGVTDPKRICIFGGSYGAYAALTGAYREPDLFRCAVGMSGVYDLPMMFEKGDIPRTDSGIRYLKEAVGTDEEELKRRSPVYNAEKIKAAVMLIHGAQDQRAPIQHATKMRAALERVGNPPEWLTESGEGHGFQDQKHRTEAYEKILAFLAKHLGP